MKKELRLRAMRNPRSLTKAEWNQLCEDAFMVPKSTMDEDTKSKLKLKQRKEWW